MKCKKAGKCLKHAKAAPSRKMAKKKGY